MCLVALTLSAEPSRIYTAPAAIRTRGNKDTNICTGHGEAGWPPNARVCKTRHAAGTR